MKADRNYWKQVVI